MAGKCAKGYYGYRTAPARSRPVAFQSSASQASAVKTARDSVEILQHLRQFPALAALAHDPLVGGGVVDEALDQPRGIDAGSDGAGQRVVPNVRGEAVRGVGGTIVAGDVGRAVSVSGTPS